MSDIFSFFKDFFGANKPEKNKVPFLHESINLKTFPVEEVKDWTQNGGYYNFSNLINSTFRDYYITGNHHSHKESVSILNSPHSSGWFLVCDKLDFSDLDYKYFAYALAMKLKLEGYVIQLAELKSTRNSDGVEMITHYYLKPSLKKRFDKHPDLANQLYGNISIEYKVFNGESLSFKFLAKSYMDSKYLPPLEFSDLNKFLFDQ